MRALPGRSSAQPAPDSGAPGRTARLGSAVRGWAARAAAHEELWLALALFVAFRLLLLVYRLVGAPLDLRDYFYYWEVAALSAQGAYPYVHYWMEYPPIFPWLAVGAYQLAALVPPWDHPIRLFYLALALPLLACEAATLVLVYALTRRAHGPALAPRAAWLYAGLFVPVQVWLGWFDALPTALLLLGLYLLVARRAGLAALAIGLGAMAKVFPLVLLPVGLRCLPARRRPLFLVVMAAILLAVALPFAVLSPDLLLASARALLGRSPWETPWALLDGYFGYGRVPPLAARFDPGSAAGPSGGPGLPLLAAFLAGLGLLLWARRRPTTPRATLALATAALAWLLLTARGYSPQFLAWLLPLLVALLPNGWGVGYALALSGVNTVEGALYFGVLASQPDVLVATVAARTVLLALVAAEGARLWLDWPLARWQPVRRLGLALGVLALGVGLALGVPAVYAGYTREAAARSPYAATIGYLQAASTPGDAVLLAEPSLYQHLAPHLRDRRLEVLDAGRWERLGPAGVGTRLDHALAAHERLWLVTNNEPQAQATFAQLAAALADRAARLGTVDLQETAVQGYRVEAP